MDYLVQWMGREGRGGVLIRYPVWLRGREGRDINVEDKQLFSCLAHEGRGQIFKINLLSFPCYFVFQSVNKIIFFHTF